MSSKSNGYVVEFSGSGGDYEYDRTDCNGRCDSICRCTKIINPRVTSIGNSLSMVNVYESSNTWKPLKLSEMVKYGIDRLFRIYQLYHVTKWKVNVVGGYYGEEVNGMCPYDHIVSHRFLEDVRAILDMSDLEIVKYLLIKEYSYIHESIADITKCEIIKLDSSELMRQEVHFSRVKNSDLSNYCLVDGLPIGVVYRGIRLIDGYHRVSISGPGKHLFINIF